MALTFFRRSQPPSLPQSAVRSPQPSPNAPRQRGSESAQRTVLVTAEALSARFRARDAERLRRYRELLDFYEGIHFASSRRGRTNLVVNYARAVVDKGVSYLFGRGVHVSVPDTGLGVGDWGLAGARPHPSPLPEGEGAQTTSPTPDAERILGRLAEDNDLDLALLQAATNASVLGDAILKVFVDAGRVRLANIDPFNVFLTWAGDDLTLREAALTGRISAAEAAERYRSLGARPPGPPSAQGMGPAGGLGAEPPVASAAPPVSTVEIWSDQRYRLIVGSETVHDGPNPYGFIPFVHIPNLQPPNSRWGISDLVDLIPLNRELDERMSDQADVIRYHADPPVVFKGVEEHSDLPVGPGTVWDLPRDADVSLLEWRGNVPALQEHIDRVLRALYEVTETPRTSFGDSGRLLSGVALETELQPLVQRTLRKRVGWSAALRRCNQMLLVLSERVAGLAPGAFAPYRSQIVWPPMLPRDDEAETRRNLALVEGGLLSHRGAMDALGDLDPETELQRVIDDRRLIESQVPGPESTVVDRDTGPGFGT